MVEQSLKNKSNSLIAENRPSFFKIILPGHTSDSLQIPPHFMKYISDEATHNVTLKVPSGGHWHIEVCQSVNGLYLQNGWQKFLTDNSLGDNEFLIFRYDGHVCFDVEIFDKQGCEREYVSVTGTHQGSVVANGKRKRGRPRKHSNGTLLLHQLKSCQQSADQYLRCCKSIKESDVKAIQRNSRTEETSPHIMETDSQLNKVEEKYTRRRINSSQGEELPNQKINSQTTPNFSREPPSEEVRERICITWESFTSKFPYFKSYLKKYNVNHSSILSIPSSFSQMHLPPHKSKIVLQNSNGRSWVVNMVPNASSNYAFCGGWCAFVRDNMLKQGDGCIFELVDKNEMQVHIVRSVKEVEFAT